MRYGPILFIAAALAVACGAPQRTDDDPGDTTPDGGGTNCGPGSTIDCTCNDGQAGKATCVADGSRYGVCQCGGSQVCVPLSTRACTCGSQSGTQACLEDGSGYGSCECAPPVCTPNEVVSCTCDNGQGGTKTCAANGSGYGNCECANPTCGSHPMSPVGPLRTDRGSVVLTDGRAQVTSQFRRGSDSFAGCIGAMTIDLSRADGSCALRLEYGAKDGSYGGLVGATFTVDGSCNALSGASGSYHARDGYGPMWFEGAASLPNSSSATSCAAASLGFSTTNLVLQRSDGATISLDLSGISIAGDLRGDGVTGLACVNPQCSPAYESVNGWCSQAPQCSANLAARVSAPNGGVVGTTVQLDGSGSTGSGLRYQWSLSKPSGSQATLASATNTRSSFVPDAPGLYTARLTVTDSAGCQSNASVDVSVTQPGATRKSLRVQLTWRADSAANGDGGDFDVHLVGPAPAGKTADFFDGPPDPLFGGGNGTDVFWNNKNPDWGLNNTTAADNVSTNNPLLDTDDSWGFGPENISQTQVFDGTFRVGAHYYCSRAQVNGQPGPTSIGTAKATVTVFVDGTAVATYTSPSLHQRDFWEPATITVSGSGSQVSVTPQPSVVNSLPVPADLSQDHGGCTSNTN